MSFLSWITASRTSILALGLFAGTAAGQTTIGANEADLFLLSTQASSGFAEMVTMLDDLDGDGWGEVAVGAPAFDPLDGSGRAVPNGGAVLVYSGQTGRLLHILGGYQQDSNAGLSCIGIADRDRDGVQDILVGVPRLTANRTVEVGGLLVFSGATGAMIGEIAGMLGERTHLGWSLASLGDLTGDGVAEFVSGAPGLGAGIVPLPGSAVVFDGDTHRVIEILTGEEAGAVFGSAVGGTSDANGDGIDDIIVGAPLQNIPNPDGGDYLDAGRAYLYSGADFSILHSFERYSDFESAMANFGTSVAGLGDLDGDGRGDLIVGVPESQQGSGGNGAVVVFSGATGDVIYDIEGTFATGEQHGVDVDGPGDIDGDGVPDFAASSSELCFGFCQPREGQVIFYSGATGDRILIFDGAQNGDGFGHAFAAGDLNEDGEIEVAVGALFANGGSNAPGLTYVFFGQDSACPADFDGNGVVDTLDFLAFLNAFSAGDPSADFNGDGSIDTLDFLAFLNAFNAGC